MVGDKAAGLDFPLGFGKAVMKLCFNRIRPKLRPPKENLHFPTENVAEYIKSWETARCVVMRGGQGETKHWAFNEPPQRKGEYIGAPTPPEVYRQIETRIVELHPMTLMQNARTSGGGVVQNVPHRAVTVGPVETWKAETVSIWQTGHHDNPFGIRLSSLMISKRIVDTSVPMSLLADHPDVRFNYLLPCMGACTVEMH